MKSIAAVAVAVALTAFARPVVAQTTITLSCSVARTEARLCREGSAAWARETGNRVELVPRPISSSERLKYYPGLLEAHSSTIDVFQIDMAWVGILAGHLMDHLSMDVGPGVIA